MSKLPYLYYSHRNVSANKTLYPFLRGYVQRLSPNSVLDYGCGDGRVWKSAELSSHTKFTMYDPNILDFIESLENSMVGKNYEIIRNINNKDKYSLVLCSLVLMVLQTENELNTAISNIAQSTKEGGTALFALTHPCFLDRVNSDYETEFVSDRSSFKYLQSPKNYTVRLKSIDDSQIVLNDVMRTLSHYISIFSKHGLLIKAFHELTCGEETSFPSFLVIESVKIGSLNEK